MSIKKVGILTGGGDCPGLNSVLYGIMLKAFDSDIECVGILKGWKGFMENKTIPLKTAEHDDLHTVGGTLLYTSRTNPFSPVKKAENEKEKKEMKQKIANDMVSKFEDLGIDALIAIGGDDTLGVADDFHKLTGANVIGCPKTIDNDVAGTDYTFGFWSGTQLASNAMDNLTTTARSHQRVFIVEIFGRDTGFLTLYSGVSSGADIILIPETPFDFEKDVVEILKKRVNAGYKYHIIATSEGAYPSDESLKRDFKTISEETIENLPKDPFGNPKLSHLKISKTLVNELRNRDDLKKEFLNNNVELEIRSVVLGHTMRAGTPNAFDRMLGLRFGLAAMKLILKEDFGKMVALKGNKIESLPLSEGVKKDYLEEGSDLMELKNLMVKIRYLSKKK
ncbi:MAG: ATP-dependent 6-phosphofructokinase [Candidatus Lokiarchaeota archaeon]|nr:ATP-dependent 6-phosphofructokinase [Candidatus Lokiarchaeota archaeon]MBD3341358.1 ATP-dependent 6-phosphofructokinase [Candidatus Lokiarchaeota archaeon]